MSQFRKALFVFGSGLLLLLPGALEAQCAVTGEDLIKLDKLCTTGNCLEHDTPAPYGGTAYSGEELNGLPHGVGSLVYSDLTTFMGSFKEGKPCGYMEVYSPIGVSWHGVYSSEGESKGLYFYGEQEVLRGSYSKEGLMQALANASLKPSKDKKDFDSSTRVLPGDVVIPRHTPDTSPIEPQVFEIPPLPDHIRGTEGQAEETRNPVLEEAQQILLRENIVAGEYEMVISMITSIEKNLTPGEVDHGYFLLAWANAGLGVDILKDMRGMYDPLAWRDSRYLFQKALRAVQQSGHPEARSLEKNIQLMLLMSGHFEPAPRTNGSVAT